MNETVTPLLRDVQPTPAPPTTMWWRRGEVVVAVLGFLGFCALVLSHATALLEPDDYAYRASIVALSQGHLLLSNAQFRALEAFLSRHGEGGIEQWHHLASGKWISEKNPGYPFFAVPFYMAKVLRLAPLFYGALACVGLYVGARAWLGRWAGTYAVWAYCFSGAALVFAWRATMPTFTDASLIAAGAGGLLWTSLETSAVPRRRLLVGLASFLALEGAVFVRYTDVVELAVALVAVIVFYRRARFSVAMMATWLASAVLFGAVDLAFNAWAYGSATSTGYDAGEITFSFSAFWPNLKLMPTQLLSSMPLWTWRRSPSSPLARAGFDGARRRRLLDTTLHATWRSQARSPPDGSSCGSSTSPTPGRPRWPDTDPAASPTPSTSFVSISPPWASSRCSPRGCSRNLRLCSAGASSPP